MSNVYKKNQNEKNLALHTTYSWNIKWQKYVGISGLWVLNEIIPKKYPENMKKNRGSCLEVAC